MKFFNYETAGRTGLGADVGGTLIDASALAVSLGLDAPGSTDALIAGDTLPALARALAEAPAQWRLAREALRFRPAVTAPQKIVCLGFNYRRHADETGTPIPKFPILFNKFNNALSAHGDTIALPTAAASQFDYEAELVIVIGRRARDVDESQALASVFGYCVGNDICARDLQMRTSQFMLGKTSDGFAPVGPYLVTADEVGDPDALDIGCWVNGEQRQASNTSNMIFGCAFTVSYLSRHMTLEPGDLIFMGTPEGVILGYPEERKVWLKPGDEVVTEIAGLGRQVVRLGDRLPPTAAPSGRSSSTS